MEAAAVLLGLVEMGAGLSVALVAAALVLFTFRRFGGIGDVQEAMKRRDPASPLVHAAGFLSMGMLVRQGLDSAFLALDLLLRNQEISGGLPEGVWTWYLRMSPEADLKAVGICEAGETDLTTWRLYRGGTSEREELPDSKFAKTAREICAPQSRRRNICLLKDHREFHLWDFSGVGNR